MTQKIEFCPICSGKMVTEIITEIFKYKGQTLEIPNYIIYRCQVCDETFPDTDQLKKLEGQIRDFHKRTDELMTSKI